MTWIGTADLPQPGVLKCVYGIITLCDIHGDTTLAEVL